LIDSSFKMARSRSNSPSKRKSSSDFSWSLGMGQLTIVQGISFVLLIGACVVAAMALYRTYKNENKIDAADLRVGLTTSGESSTPGVSWWDDLMTQIATNRADPLAVPITYIEFSRGANNVSLFQIPEPAAATVYDLSGIHFFADDAEFVGSRDLNVRERLILEVPNKVQFKGLTGIYGPIHLRYSGVLAPCMTIDVTGFPGASLSPSTSFYGVSATAPVRRSGFTLEGRAAIESYYKSGTPQPFLQFTSSSSAYVPVTSIAATPHALAYLNLVNSDILGTLPAVHCAAVGTLGRCQLEINMYQRSGIKNNTLSNTVNSIITINVFDDLRFDTDISFPFRQASHMTSCLGECTLVNNLPNPVVMRAGSELTTANLNSDTAGKYYLGTTVGAPAGGLRLGDMLVVQHTSSNADKVYVVATLANGTPQWRVLTMGAVA